MASCTDNDVGNDASLLPTNMVLADRLCKWLQCLLSKALVHKSPKARGPEVEMSDERDSLTGVSRKGGFTGGSQKGGSREPVNPLGSTC